MPFDARLLGGISVLAAVVETGNFVRAAGHGAASANTTSIGGQGFA